MSTIGTETAKSRTTVVNSRGIRPQMKVGLL